ncbi:MAG TPA: MHYT domain-containing protein [Thermodesulfobacteriota bacterium]|nr:MHYT domain-containing protein [Thermodesulfobacteriota bacterium]
MLSDSLSITMTSSYDSGLVLLSIVIAIFASYVALDLAGQVTVAQGRSRQLWLLGGATAMGVGIWSMHFIAMLAFSLPVPIRYHVPTVVLSMIAAIVASAIALYVVSRPAMGTAALLAGGVLMGSGIGTMHYTGMAAMRLAARTSYDPLLFVLSVVIAVVVSLVALWLAFHLRTETSRSGVLQRGVSAVVMGCGIVGLHYTAMAAASFTPVDAAAAVQAPAAAADTSWLAGGIGIATGLILALALAGSFLSRRAPQAGAGAAAATRY